ncbi:MAG: ABC transporter permease [Alphaproteobacteria bacterium CG_4_10_14_0_2_um_filter_63_37]|nr:MAG: hypothetical protein AUJ55_08300 [Proteobacteria bacterium CG1_02_64_396]PJA23589.1 MAG: ABC transporter permease [Alphaproteobacteria bacterium CG_4_10_14_0_2_um_filter_63_37]
MNRDTFWLLIYLAAVLAGTLVHDPLWLGAAWLVCLLLAGPQRLRLLRKTLAAIVLFNLTVSVGYLIVASAQHTFAGAYLLLVNLRVGWLTFLAFWLASRVHLPRALAFAPNLARLLTVAYAMTLRLLRLHQDHKLAQRSRTLAPPTLQERIAMSAAGAGHVLDRATHAATEVTQAMRSRGLFEGNQP